jgi:hypothetical protein
MGLRPAITTQKALISTTGRFFGEYETDDVLLTHAWAFSDSGMMRRLVEGPASRTAFIFACQTEPPSEDPPGFLPDYSLTGDLICAYLAVLFGKRFDNHGLIETNGLFQLPDLTQFGHLCDVRLPQNSHKSRIDFPVPLNLVEVSRIERLFRGDTLDHRCLKAFHGAAKFYLQALQNAERDPEVAYLHLITAGEILSSFFQYEKDDLLDAETKQHLDQVKIGMPDGPRIASLLSGKLRQVKRSFVRTIVQLTDGVGFFDRSESSRAYGRFKTETFRDCVAAAYDLRSRYVHTGVPFGHWISENHCNNEVQIGQPVVGDGETEKILARAPTYIGLERAMRHSLLRFAQMQGVYVQPKD